MEYLLSIGPTRVYSVLRVNQVIPRLSPKKSGCCRKKYQYQMLLCKIVYRIGTRDENKARRCSYSLDDVKNLDTEFIFE